MLKVDVLDINKEVLHNGDAILKNGDNNNCAVNSLAIACNVPYDQAHAYAQKNWGRNHGQGTKTKAIVNDFRVSTPFGKMTVEVTVTQEYKQPGGWMRKRCMNVQTFIKKYPSGTYYVLVRGHALVVKDGVLIDNSTRLKRRVHQAWKIS